MLQIQQPTTEYMKKDLNDKQQISLDLSADEDFIKERHNLSEAEHLNCKQEEGGKA